MKDDRKIGLAVLALHERGFKPPYTDREIEIAASMVADAKGRPKSGFSQKTILTYARVKLAMAAGASKNKALEMARQQEGSIVEAATIRRRFLAVQAVFEEGGVFKQYESDKNFWRDFVQLNET